MSIRALNWAMHQVRTDGPSAQAVLFVVADTANADGISRHADPDYIAERSRQSRATVFRRLAELEHFGAVERFSEVAPDGRRRYELRLRLDREVDYDGAMVGAMRVGHGEAEDRPNEQVSLAPGSQIETDPGSQIETGTVSPVRLPQSHSCDPIRNPSESKNLPPSPPPGGAGTEDRFREFKAGYPDGIVDPLAAQAAFTELSSADQKACLAGLAVYAARCRRRAEKSMKAHLFVRKRAWEGLMAAPAAEPGIGGPYDPSSEAGRALATLARIGGTTLPRVGDGRLIYPRPITPQLLALAVAPSGGAIYQIGTKNFAAWRGFLGAHLANMRRLDEIAAPWPWPPRKDGSISTGPPAGELATEQDFKDFAM